MPDEGQHTVDTFPRIRYIIKASTSILNAMNMKQCLNKIYNIRNMSIIRLEFI